MFHVVKGLFPYYIISYNKQGSFQMIIEDYNKGTKGCQKRLCIIENQSPIDFEFENILEETYIYQYLHIIFAKTNFVPALFINYIINLKH